MRHARGNLITGFLLLAAMLCLAGPAAAVKGDKLYSGAERTVVRRSPEPDAGRLMVLERGHLLVGIIADGTWIQVGVARTGGKIGWVRRRDLSTIKMRAQSAAPNPGFEYFANELDSFNAGVASETGAALFLRIEAVTRDMLHLTASPMWRALPRRAMRRNLALLSSRWARLNASGNPTWLEVVDEDGKVLMSERRGP